MDYYREHPDWREDREVLSRVERETEDSFSRGVIERTAEVLRQRGNPTPLLGALMAAIVDPTPGVDYDVSVCDRCGDSSEHDHDEEDDSFVHWLDGRVDRADR